MRCVASCFESPCGDREPVCEKDLPTCVRDALAAARASRPTSDLMCISFHTQDSGREIARMGPAPEFVNARGAGDTCSRLRPKEVLILSVAVTETTVDTVQTVTRVLVVRMRPRPGD